MKPLRAKVIPLLGLLFAVLLVGCNQGNTAGADASSSQQESAQQTIPLAATVTGAEGIVIDNYMLVSSTRIGRTVYEYTYKADVSNWGSGDATITATLASNAPQITVVQGGLSFGEVIEGATQESTDTFTIRHDRSQPFDESALVWTVQATPLAPTTFELIDQALANGVIDAETALVYKVYYEFNDGRLPAQYVGRDDGFFEAVAVREAQAVFNTLSVTTQQILAPFLQFPDFSGLLAVAPQSAGFSGSLTGAAPLLAVNNVSSSIVPTVTAQAAATNQAHVIQAQQGNVLIGWVDDPLLNAYFEEWANRSKVEIETNIWPKLTGLFGVPATGTRILILLDPSPKPIPSIETTDDCITAKIGLKQDNKIVLAHELVHALLDLDYPGKCNSNDTRWLHEATATWGEHFVYPLDNSEHIRAAKFLNVTKLPLELQNVPHSYGAYLWFLFITNGDATGTKNANTQRVPATWAALANHDSLGAVNAAVNDIGGLEKQWPKFALYNWNRIQRSKIILSTPPKTSISGEPYTYYGQWDGLATKARESTGELPKKVTLDGKAYKVYGLPHLIHHLGAAYWHYDFRDDDNIRRVRLKHPYANGSQPTAKVQVLVKLRNQEWKPVEDWTGYERKTLCRDKPEEDFEELVVVISNSEFTNRNQVLDQTAANETIVEVSAFGCSNWKGTVHFSAKSGASDDIILSESGVATNVTLEILEDGFVGHTFSLTGGNVNWQHSGSYSRGSDTCAGTSSGSYSLAGSLMGAEWFNAFAGVADLTPRYIMNGVKYFGVTPPDDYVCTSAPLTDSPIYGSYDIWLDMHERVLSGNSPGLYDSDPTGNVLQGSSIIVEPSAMGPAGNVYTKTRTYTWTFEKNGTFDGEPLP
jgi:hypothetical protein